MTVTWHRPLAAGPPGPAVRHVHLKVWARAEVEAWDAVREAHLHLVRPFEEEGGRGFRRVDLARAPLRPAPDGEEPAEFRARALGWYREWLEGWRPRLWRCAELGLVSDLGDTEAGFRRRVLRVLQPELERYVEEARRAAAPRLPWRRRRARSERQRALETMAARVGRLAASLEAWEPDSVESLVRAVEVGLLSVGVGLGLPAQGSAPSFPTISNLKIE